MLKSRFVSQSGYQTLAATSESFLRLETLGEANDRVSNAMAALPIFRQYDLGDALRSSSDGQKFETGLPTVNARYSPKYFGLHKGVVSYSLVANHVPVYAKIIGANEHESHYVLDVLLNNTTDIQPTVHSTDTHGTNAVNFALLHLFAISSHRATAISMIQSGPPSMAFGIPATMARGCSSPSGKSTPASSLRNGPICCGSSSPWPSRPRPRALSWGNSMPMPTKTKPVAPCGNMTISFAVCICWTTSIPRP